MRFFRSYIRYLSNEKKEIQRVHAVFIAAILTGVFTGAYLYILYDIAPPAPQINIINNKKVYVRDHEADELYMSPMVDNEVKSEPADVIPPENSIYKIADIFENLQFRIGELKSFLSSDNSYRSTAGEAK